MTEREGRGKRGRKEGKNGGTEGRTRKRSLEEESPVVYPRLGLVQTLHRRRWQKRANAGHRGTNCCAMLRFPGQAVHILESSVPDCEMQCDRNGPGESPFPPSAQGSPSYIDSGRAPGFAPASTTPAHGL